MEPRSLFSCVARPSEHFTKVVSLHAEIPPAHMLVHVRVCTIHGKAPLVCMSQVCASVCACMYRYLLLQFHHLLHELVGPYLGVGSKLTTDMFIHHIITLSYIVMGSYMRITKWGVVWLVSRAHACMPCPCTMYA